MILRSKLAMLVSVAVLGSSALVALAQDPGNPPEAFEETRVRSRPAVERPAPGNEVRKDRTARIVRDDETVVTIPGTRAPDFSNRSYTTITRPVYAVRAVGQEHRLAQEAEELVRQLAAAKNQREAGAIGDKLHQVLQDQFALRQQRHEKELAELEDQVRKLRELVNKRQEHRGEIIEHRIQEMLQEANGLGW